MNQGKEGKCAVCNGDFDFHELFCMLSQRGANSNCKDHPNRLICTKCGRLDKEIRCPHCQSSNVTLPKRTSIGGKWLIVRQCLSCLRILEPDGKQRRAERLR